MLCRRNLVWPLLTASIIICGPPLAAPLPAADREEGFVSLFDGKSLDGWQLVDGSGRGYVVEDGAIVCPKDGGGRLFTNKEYANFIFRFEYRLEPHGNNGVGIRSPLEGDPAYVAMEIQVLDDDHPDYAKLQPYQYHGSIYGVVASKRDAPKKAGEWNSEEIACDGRKVKVTVNDKVIVDADLDDVQDKDILTAHPGLQRTKGYIGFLGHGEHVEFRNLRIKELP